jgi:long-chain acyl-CoA synthetase
MNLATDILCSVDKNFKRTVIVHQGRKWTYGVLGEQAESICHKLKTAGLMKGDRVILWMENSVDYVASYVGILLAQGVVVALHPQLLSAEVVRLGAHVQAKAIITVSKLWDLHQEPLRDTNLSFALIDGNLLDLGHIPQKLNCPEGLAQIIYTSGTTGKPKGVMLSHGNLIANSYSILDYLQLTSEDSIIALLPFVFAYGNSILLTHLLCGGKLVVENGLTFPKMVIDSMSNEAVTGLSGVASTYALLLRQSSFTEVCIPSMRYFTSAGGPMPVELLRRVQNSFPGREFIVMYGQTEASARLTYLPSHELEAKKGSAGKALPGVELKTIRDDGSLAPPCEVGEILARGPNIMLGYWQDPENTSKVLKEGWLHTGDLGYLDRDGFVFISGRNSEMIKSGAYRISPVEIEEVLFNHPTVGEAVVVGLEDDLMGSLIMGLVVPRSGNQPTTNELLAHCARYLAPFKRPKFIRIVPDLPKSPNGKIQRHVIREMCRSFSSQSSLEK